MVNDHSVRRISASGGSRAARLGGCVAAVVMAGLLWWMFRALPGSAPEAAPTPILRSSPDVLPTGHVHPPRALVDALFRDTFQAQVLTGFEECRKGKGLQTMPIERWFVSVPLPPIDGQPQLHFVRPALEPFCMTFYGAHTFNYWLVQQHGAASAAVFRVVDFDTGDFVHVLPTHHGGIYDLERGLCTALQCTYVTQQRQGESFALVNCRREHFADGQRVSRELLDCKSLGD